jgi:heterodisulfide reductase subunit A
MPLAKGEFGYGICRNVVSALEFERILDEDGPYGGLLLRPFDGEIPEKIAFILMSNVKTDEAGNNAKDLLSCTLKEAISALTKTDDLEISVFVSAQTDPGPRGEAEKKGIQIRTAEVLEVNEAKDTRNLLVTYLEESEKKQEEFDMIVLSKEPEIRPELRALYQKLARKDPDERE